MEQHANDIIKPVYSYSAFGLRIDSEIMLPELSIAEDGPADVQIRYGEVPDKLDTPLDEAYFFQASAGEFLFKVEGVANYYITNGEQIIVQPSSQLNFRTIKLYLLGTAIGVLLMQRGIVPIHGSTVAINGCGVIFTGVSGAGKSTMAAALHKKGYPLLADDISAVTCDQDGIFRVQPGYPQQKLCQASADIIDINTQAYDRISEDRNKYAIPVSAGFRKLPVPIAGVYIINVNQCADLSIVPFKGIAKLAIIMGNTYRAEFINGLGLKIAHFKQCGSLAKQVQAFCLTRPDNIMTLNRQVDMLIEHCLNHCSLRPDIYDNLAREAGGMSS